MEDFVAGGICCSIAAVFYYYGRNPNRNAEILQSVPRCKLEDLAHLMDANISPKVVTISGRVVCETPITGKLSGLGGAIVEERVEERHLKRDVAIEEKKKSNSINPVIKNYGAGEADSWKPDYELKSVNHKEALWYLDDGTGRALVVRAWGGTGFELPVGSSTFEKSNETRFHEKSDWFPFHDKSEHFQLIKIIGLKRIERVLPVGTSLTVVGQPVRDSVGAIRIQRPHNGPFYVSQQTIDEHIENFKSVARLWQCASVYLTVFGVSLMVNALCHTSEDSVAVNCGKDS